MCYWYWQCMAFSFYYRGKWRWFLRIILFVVFGDDMTANPGSNKQAVAELDAFSSVGDNKGVKDAWNQHFNVIKAANFIIDGVEKTPVDQSEINIALGNALYWRAYGYFYLVRVFGPVPLLLKTASSTEIAEEFSKLCTADCWTNYNRGTSGKWYEPTKLDKVHLQLVYASGVLSVYLNGLLDQQVKIVR